MKPQYLWRKLIFRQKPVYVFAQVLAAGAAVAEETKSVEDKNAKNPVCSTFTRRG